MPEAPFPHEPRLYRYDAVDREFLQQRIAEFRGQVARRLSGELTEEEFKPLRLMNGLYLQLHAYMLRVAIPYGVLSAAQLRQLALIARRWDRGWGHFTTRQNIQFNWTKLTDVVPMLEALAAVDMHAIQTSGNCIRNTTTDEFAGAAPDEAVDPRVYTEILRQWSTLHPEFTWLPRKFKVAVSGAEEDRIALRTHDVAVRVRAGARFDIFVGGGMGRTPILALPIFTDVAEQDFIRHMEAILRVYNALGQRANIYKARIKILVRDLGAEGFRALVEEELARMPAEPYRLAPEVVAAIRAHFAPPPFAPQPEVALPEDAEFRAWVATNVKPHRAPGYASVVVSLKPVGGIPGDASAEQMEAVAALAEAHSFGEIRVSHTQNLVLPHVPRAALHTLWQALGAAGLATANFGQGTDIIACPGLDFCALANARSIPVSQRISRRVDALDRAYSLGDLQIKISGCINACGHHHVGHIGILGVDKHGAEAYQITLGGAPGNDAAIGELIGPSFSYDEIDGAVETILRAYLARREAGERFLDTWRRLGAAPFKEALYGAG
jgi:sulfite reductase (NADPH) hemoprotein beta-component